MKKAERWYRRRKRRNENMKRNMKLKKANEVTSEAETWQCKRRRNHENIEVKSAPKYV
jgi:hypothetical protein